MTEPQLEPELERVALALLRHLEWQESGFSLSFLFADFGTSQRLAHWVNERLRLMGRPLQRHEVEPSEAERPEDLVDRLVERTSPRHQPLWFGFQKFAADDAWNNARCRFLARLNERRFLLEKQFARPLVLVLPVGFREQARTLAPDIWHVRSMSEEFESPPRAAKGPALTEPSPAALAATPPRADIPVPAYDDWVRIRGHDGLDRMEPHAASVVVSELLAAGRPGDARRVSQEALEFAQRKDRNDGRRGLMFANACVGDVALACGDWPEARRAYSKALQFSREIHRASAGSLESMRDLSISLDNMGRVAEAQSEWKLAEEVYRESLEISRALQERLGGTPESMRDLSVSLDNIGRVAEAQSEWKLAEEVYRESLEIRRALQERLGGTPESMRDLSVSLNNMGRVAEAQSEWKLAEEVYRESLEIGRALLERSGGTPGSMRDLSVSLNNMGRVAEARSEWKSAEKVYRESLEIRRALQERLGRTPRSLADLRFSLQGLERAVTRQGDLNQAAVLAAEAEAIEKELGGKVSDRSA